MKRRLPFTVDELELFDTLTNMCSSQNQVERFTGRMETKKFVDKHGERKCQYMFGILQERDKKGGKR